MSFRKCRYTVTHTCSDFPQWPHVIQCDICGEHSWRGFGVFLKGWTLCHKPLGISKLSLHTALSATGAKSSYSRWRWWCRFGWQHKETTCTSFCSHCPLTSGFFLHWNHESHLTLCFQYLHRKKRIQTVLWSVCTLISLFPLWYMFFSSFSLGFLNIAVWREHAVPLLIHSKRWHPHPPCVWDLTPQCAVRVHLSE